MKIISPFVESVEHAILPPFIVDCFRFMKGREVSFSSLSDAYLHGFCPIAQRNLRYRIGDIVSLAGHVPGSYRLRCTSDTIFVATDNYVVNEKICTDSLKDSCLAFRYVKSPWWDEYSQSYLLDPHKPAKRPPSIHAIPLPLP